MVSSNDGHNTLRRISELESDLRSEIVHQKEEGHYEGYGGFVQEQVKGKGIVHKYEPRQWVVTKEKIAEPDTEKRKKARTELEKIYLSTRSCKIRYNAGKALGYQLSNRLFINKNHNKI